MEKTRTALPPPDADSLAHSKRVAEHIREVIEESGGSIGFGRFMHLALYAPGLGYYSAGARKFGEGGDFTTAPEVSPLFGRVLARQCAPVLRELPRREVLELGAGSGALAVQMLTALREQGVAPSRYSILEISPDLKRRQEESIRRDCPEMLSRVVWLQGLPERLSGVVIANEVADALPVERFRKTGEGVLQFRVVADGTAFGWREARAPDFLQAAVRHIEDTLEAPLPEGYVSEVSTGLPAWIAGIGASLDAGLVLLVDYGLRRREYYAPDRSGGWLRCHFRHLVHGDPLVYPGIQDLSAWVDFTTVAEAATAARLDVAGYTTQAQFLLHGGLEQELAGFARLSTDAQLDLSRQVRMLTLPGEMGEHFKCIALARNCGRLPAALESADKAHTL
jgi:SAM-dependent MidA family methyltransferase